MFNYADIDKYPTLLHLSLIMDWYKESSEHGSMMVTHIDRNGMEYTFHISNAYMGFTSKFRIEGDKAVFLGKEGFWMS